MIERIKFRGYTNIPGEKNNWIYGFLVPRLESYYIKRKREKGWHETRVDENSIGQWTGLVGKNGVEIYENDLIKGMMDFGPGGFAEKEQFVKWHPIYGYQWTYWLTETIQVIGNLYEGVKNG